MCQDRREDRPCMRTENSIKNVSVGIGGQLISSVMSFISRTVFVYTLSAEYLGISGLFSNILTVLSLAELGMGNAILFSMYKPIAEDNEALLKALVKFYGKVYRLIGFVVGTAGLLLIPFLRFFIRDIPDIPYFILIYILYLVNTVVSYFFSYKCSVLDANQKQYIGQLIRYKYVIIRDVFQMIVLFCTHNFIFYLILQVLSSVYTNWKVSKEAEHNYPWLMKLEGSGQLNGKVKKEIKKNVFAMFNHNVGSVIVNGTDNILISKFAGLVDVGLYSNYCLVLNGIVAIVSKVSEAISASVGNMGVSENEDKIYTVYRVMNLLNFWIYSFCSVCFWSLLQPFVTLWLGEGYLLEDTVVLILCINFYISGMRRVNITFRDAMGLFWYDRYKPIAEAGINLVASIYFAKRMGIAGVFLGTILSNMLTGFWVEPFVLYKYKFHKPLSSYMLGFVVYTFVMLIGGITISILSKQLNLSGVYCIVIRLIYCVIIINVLYLVLFYKTDEFLYLRKYVFPKAGRFFRKSKN